MTGPGSGADNDLVQAPDAGHGRAHEAAEIGAGRMGDPQPDVPGPGNGPESGNSGITGNSGANGTAVGSGRVSLLRTGAAAVGGVLAAVTAVLLARNGVRTNTFPPFIPGTSSTTITRYSGPWLTAGAGAALVAALLMLWAVVDLRRWVRARRADRAGERIAGTRT